jgi:hypothetical protein
MRLLAGWQHSGSAAAAAAAAHLGLDKQFPSTPACKAGTSLLQPLHLQHTLGIACRALQPQHALSTFCSLRMRPSSSIYHVAINEELYVLPALMPLKADAGHQKWQKQLMGTPQLLSLYVHKVKNEGDVHSVY